MFNNKKWLAFTLILFFALSLVLIKSAQANSSFVFNKNLSAGSASTDVKELQKFLNINGFIIAKSGAGSLGRETAFFGPATRNALIKFQKSNKIVPAAGYFGSITRIVVNKTVKPLVTSSSLVAKQVAISQPVGQTNQISKNEGYYFRHCWYGGFAKQW